MIGEEWYKTTIPANILLMKAKIKNMKMASINPNCMNNNTKEGISIQADLIFTNMIIILTVKEEQGGH
jgi:hypothetical protein